MAIEIIDVQKKNGGGSSAVLPAFAVDPIAGDTILVGVGSWNGAGHTAPDGSAGNTYTAIGSIITQGAASVSMWLAKNIVGGSSFVVTAHPANHYGVSAWCVRGLKADPYNNDVVSGTGTNPTTDPTFGPTTPPPGLSFFFAIISIVFYKWQQVDGDETRAGAQVRG